MSLPPLLRKLSTRLTVVTAASGMAAACFLVLPLIQAISAAPVADLTIRTADTANVPPPPPPPEPEPEQEPEPEEAPPELSEPAAPLDLSQLELALNPGGGGGDGWLAGDFAVNLEGMAGGEDVDALFSISDLDAKPRVIYQASPVLTAKVRKKAPGTVYILFIVDQDGRVENPIVQKSTDPVFERPALNAVKQWRFEPGKRSGEPVRFRMRVPITFPKS